MADKIMDVVRSISNSKVQREGTTCYPSTTGAYSALLTNIGIEIEVYGNPAIKARVLKILENHLSFLPNIT
jgi:hypothetical protein